MHFEIVTLFPESFQSFFSTGLMSRAVREGIVSVDYLPIRPSGFGSSLRVDDTLYGGGEGMLIRYDVMSDVMKQCRGGKKILLSPRGTPLRQREVVRFSKETQLTLICGHYEGFDQRFIDEFIDEEVSIGDYILGRGETAATVFIEAVSRLLKGYMSKVGSHQRESFSDALLEEDQYTKPSKYQGRHVPSVLESGDHSKIETWRRKSRLLNTLLRRFDLYKKLEITRTDARLLMEFFYGEENSRSSLLKK